MKWTADQIPDQTGKVILITGANIGLGYQSALELARKGGNVILTCRDWSKCASACDSISRQAPGSSVQQMDLDLASLESVRQFVATFLAQYDRLDILMNNAGIMAIPKRKSKDGFELQFATNHLGHFALTGLLMGLILRTSSSRVVTVSSALNLFGKIYIADLNLEHNYGPWKAYNQSKLANLYFTVELQRRLEDSGATAISVAAHPGYADTNLRANMFNGEPRGLTRLYYKISALPAQSLEMGALPQLYAAVAPGVHGGDYYGPSQFFQQRGAPKLIRRMRPVVDPILAKRLWELSEDMTQVRYLN